MRKRKKRKSVGKDAPVRLRQVPYPGCGALGGAQKAAAQEGDQEGLPFRVDLPSRRWLEQAAPNGPASTSR